jgi:hypothetical protein
LHVIDAKLRQGPEQLFKSEPCYRKAANQPCLTACNDTVARATAIGMGKSLMQTHLPALAIMALVGFCNQANAQARCPELVRLRSDAAAAVEQMRGAPTSDRCAAYVRFSVVWGEIAQYANGHRELCDISIASLNEFEKRHREAVKARHNVCAGRPLRAFPADVIQR